MGKCFVIQPFDGAAFDRRFDDVLAPAIVAAGMEPYRVDRDPTVVVPIDAIELGIRGADACVADISLDNPNVWFELGYAIAIGAPLVLLCNVQRRERFPFDVQHRHVIRYQTEAPSDFEGLRAEIESRLASALKRERSVQALVKSPLPETEGLEPHEVSALVLIAEGDLDPDSAPSAHTIKNDMGRMGYTELAAVLGVKALLGKGFVVSTQVSTYNGDPYAAFQLTPTGTDWLLVNRSRLAMKKETGKARHSQSFADFPEDELPF